MTQKDYIIIAKAINDSVARLDHNTAHNIVYVRIVQNLTLALKRDNPKFNADKFERACLGTTISNMENN